MPASKEEVKESDNPEIETDDQLLQIIEAYEKGFKERSDKRQKMMEKKREENVCIQTESRTQGKHVFSLC